jgi:uncharacterized protein (TIGR04255 family)
MTLNFPIVEDIHLGNNPLREVICQVKFPKILRIAENEPADFQERIRARFPVYEIERSVVVEMEAAKLGGRAGFRPPIHRFLTPDRTMTVSLSQDFYALSVTNYNRWGDFAEQLAFITNAARSIFNIPYAIRIGLRYINALDIHFVESEQFSDVIDLLRNELTVMLKTGVIEDPDLALQRIQTSTDGDRFTFRYGIIQEGEPPGPVFMLDFDHYVEAPQLSLEDLLERCDNFHERIYNAFRWCIAPDKLEVFQPSDNQR